MEKQDYDVVIAGAGASGLAAAIAAARAGASVLVLEKNHVPGRKLLSTGSGKCNFSNLRVRPADYRAGGPAFLKRTFSALPPAEVHEFFDGLGLLRAEKDGGRLFPRSLKAQDVQGVLLNELEALKVPVLTLTEVLGIRPDKTGFAVEAAKVAPVWVKNAPAGVKKTYRAGRVVLAAGGAAYPQIGGSDKGCGLLQRLGHTVSALSPALVPLRVKEPLVKELDGVRLDAALALKAGGKTLAAAEGELLFTAYGVSGPAVLDLSRAALAALNCGPVLLEADFFGDYTAKAFREFLLARAAAFAGRPFRHFATGLLNEKLMRAAAWLCGIDWNAPAGPNLEVLAGTLKCFSLEVTGSLGFQDAMVSAGGCSCAEIDAATFASKKIKGLYVTGELLDIDGGSGGFNLHFAWTSGLLAGRCAAGK
ncbi:MAG: aminoacetone oxidase family FAD-binding enzyme [Elusimicrobiota bacterium]